MWREYLREPRGESRQDWHAGSICNAIYNAMGSSKEPIKIEDCLVKFQDPNSINTEDTTINNLLILKKSFKGVIPSDVFSKIIEE